MSTQDDKGEMPGGLERMRPRSYLGENVTVDKMTLTHRR